MRKLLLPAIAGALLLASVAARAAPRAVEPTSVTPHWAGYVVHAAQGSFATVRAGWVQPRVTCNRPGSSAAVWIGVGGASRDSRALEQIGTSADCSQSAVSSYTAWYQLYPEPPVELPVRIRPGDAVAAEVNVTGWIVRVALRNLSSGASFATDLWMRAPETDSAEWIVEAPSACFVTCTQLPLAELGRVSFARASTEVAGHPGAIRDRGWSARRLEMRLPRGRTAALAGPLSRDGSSFDVIWPKVKR